MLRKVFTLKMTDTKLIALTIVIAATYTAGVVVLEPISFSIYQCRVADALLALSTIYGLPVILGTSIGCFIANIIGGFGVVDIVGGTVANLIATTAGYLIAKRKFKGWKIVSLVLESIIVAGIVGSYLSLIFKVSIIIGFTSILVGSLISIGLIGYILIESLERFHLK